MIVINFDEYNINRRKILSDIKKSLFVYPTDTIYGIGCDATNDELVAKVRKIKRSGQPFSVIVPTKEWIYNNCVITEEAEEWIRKLPGPYTLILKLKNKKAISKSSNNGEDTIGIRMPNHWFLAVSFTLKTPIITTSANISGKEFMTSLDDLDPEIRENVDYVFYDGPKSGHPSTIIHLEGPSIQIQKREERKSKHEIKFPIKEIQF